MKILVCGGRTFDQQHIVNFVLDRLNPTFIIHGDAKGADKMAGKYATQRQIPQQRYPANWGDMEASTVNPVSIKEFPYGHPQAGKRYNALAGHNRNAKMLADHPDIDLVVAFPGGTGTANMVMQAKKAGKTVINIGMAGEVTNTDNPLPMAVIQKWSQSQLPEIFGEADAFLF